MYPSNILDIFYAAGAVIKAWICSLGKKLLSNLRGEREEEESPGPDGGFQNRRKSKEVEAYEKKSLQQLES